MVRGGSMFSVKFFGIIGVLTLVVGFTPLSGWSQDGDSGSKDESKERLIRKARGESKDDVMARVILRMDEAGLNLFDRFDAGEKTQRLQRQVLKELDLAIRQAKKNMHKISSTSKQKADQRKAGDPAEDSDSEQGRAKSASQSADQAGGGPGSDDVEAAKAGALRERRRQWGHLPPRDRDELRQGFSDDILEKYRRQIERYYKALSNPENDE